MALVNGYEAIWLDGKTTLVHRLMWESFYGVDIPEDCEIHHLDGNRKNNDISNLVCIEKWRHHVESGMMIGTNPPTEECGQTLRKSPRRREWSLADAEQN